MNEHEYQLENELNEHEDRLEGLQHIHMPRRPRRFIDELVDNTGSNQAVRDFEASMELFSGDVDAAIEATLVEQKTEQGLIGSLLAMLRNTGIIT